MSEWDKTVITLCMDVILIFIWVACLCVAVCSASGSEPSSRGFEGGGIDLVTQDILHDGQRYSWHWYKGGECYFVRHHGDRGTTVPLADARELWPHVNWQHPDAKGFPRPTWYSEPSRRFADKGWGVQWTNLKSGEAVIPYSR